MFLLEYNKFTEADALRVNGVDLFLAERVGTEKESMNAAEQTSATLWDSSVILSKYLEANAQLIEGKSCIELGAGKGLVGLYCAALGGKVLLTDMKKATHTLLKTIQGNPRLYEKLEVKELDWRIKHDLPKFEVILGSDIVWVLDLVTPLVETIVSLSSDSTNIYLADQQRSKICQDRFFEEIRANGFNVQLIPWQHEWYSKNSVSIHHICKQSNSYR